jgi:hypothetical protein
VPKICISIPHLAGFTANCLRKRLRTVNILGTRNLYLEGLGKHNRCISRAHFLPVIPCRPHAASTGTLHTVRIKEATKLNSEGIFYPKEDPLAGDVGERVEREQRKEHSLLASTELSCSHTSEMALI